MFTKVELQTFMNISAVKYFLWMHFCIHSFLVCLMKCEYNDVQYVWVLRKLVQGWLNFCYEQKHNYIYPYIILLSITLHAQHHSLLGWGMVTFCRYCYDGSLKYQYGSDTATLWPQNIMLLTFSIFLRNKTSGIMCSGPRILNNWCSETTLGGTTHPV